ncbi:MAG: hypothetical protein AB1690_02440 [Candidatus Zixiibacteriota bacterium]
MKSTNFRKRRIAVILLLGFLALWSINILESATLADIYRSVRGRSLYFDSRRITDSLIRQFTNEEAENIAILGSALERETTIVLTGAAYEYTLPSDFYLGEAVILNPNPAPGSNETPRPSALKYSPLRDYGRNPAFESGRPTQWSVFNDKIRFDRVSQTELDTATLFYFAHHEILTDTTDTLDLPQQFEPLLIDRVVLKCYSRINFSPPDKEELLQNILFIEQKLLGRPVDER